MFTINKKSFSLIIAFLLSLFFVTTNSDSTSPLFSVRAIDSQIFQYMGFYITQGGIPYSGLFDHKGLLIYWINALGYILSPKYGVLLLQIAHLTITLVIWYRLLSLAQKEWQKYILLLLSLLCLYAYYFRGNLTEEWSLLFISYPFMAYYESIKNNNVTIDNKKLFLIGLCIGALALLRLNNASPVLGLLLYCLIDATRKKEFLYIFRAMKYVSAGCIIPIIIACSYMFYKNGIQGIYDMYYANITFNIDYSIDRGFSGFNTERQFTFIYKVLLPALLIIPLIKKAHRFVLPLLFAFILTYATIGSTQSWHYLIIFIPLIVASFSCLTMARYKYVAWGVITLLYAKTIYRQFDISHFNFSGENTYYEVFHKLIVPIPEAERNNIWNLNATFLVDDFRNEKIIQQNRMIFPFQLSVSKTLYDEECGKFQKTKPKYVIYADYKETWMKGLTIYNKYNNYKESKTEYFYLQSHYKLISSACWKDGTKLYCYQIKNE